MESLEKYLIRELEAAATAHENGNYEVMREKFNEFESALAHYEDRSQNINLVYNFWDCWLDASNHEWQYHEPVEKQDWPDLAREIVSDLKAKRDIKNPIILNLK